MKKLTILLIILYSLTTAVSASPGYEPGITGDATPKKGEFRYSEVIFLSGEPMLLQGTVEVKEDSRGTRTTLKYNLENASKAAKLTRSVIYTNSESGRSAGTQSTYTGAVDPKFSETVEIGSDTYELTDYLFSRSGIQDDRTVIIYRVSNWNGRKVYSKNDGAGQVIIDINSEQYGYDNFWSSTETSFIKNAITYRYKDSLNDTDYKEEYGTVEYAVSHSKLKLLQYVNNDPLDISFKGGYILKESQENIVSYIYDIPAMKGGKPTEKRNRGKDSCKVLTVPTQQRTLACNISDISPNYWAAEDIRKITSMDIISLSGSSYFRPLSFMSRGEFARAVIKASDMAEVAGSRTRSRTYEQLYIDVEKNHPYAEYINRISNAGIMDGIGKNKFGPDEYLTKAQAAAIIVRAMGLEESSAESGLKTPFKDDGKIQPWARKSINIAHRMGIITGNTYNEIEPDRILTRAESAAMINRFIKYLQYDIRQEYREKIINFGH